MNYNINIQYVQYKNKENTDKQIPFKVYHPEITTSIHTLMHYNYRYNQIEIISYHLFWNMVFHFVHLDYKIYLELS